MADQDEGWTVVAKPTAAKAATSSDGWTVVTPAKTTAAPVEQEQTGSVGHNVARTAAEAVIPTGSAFAGAAAGATIAAPYAASAAALSGPFAPVVGGAVELGGVLGGAFLASGAAKKVQDMLHQLVAPEDYKQRQIEKEQNPVSTFATELGTGLIGASPKTAVTATQGLSKLGRIAASPGGQRAVSGALQGGLEAGTELASEGEINPWKVIAATGAGVAMPGVNAAGRIPLAIGEKIGGKISSVLPGGTKPVTPDVTSNTDLPPKPTAESTPEERAVYIDSLKKRLAEKNAQVPVTEAAFRNKETGEVERVGKSHDEQRKIDTADTHEQGFVDERGNFLTRKEAAERVGTSGQVPVETYVTKEMVSPSKTAESITSEIEALNQRLVEAERSDAYNVSSEVRAQIKSLEQKLELVKQYGPTEPKYRDVTKTGPKLVEPEVGLRSQDLRNAGDERFTISETPVDTTVSEQKPYDPNQLVTRDDYRTVISDKENKILTTELLAEEALAKGDQGTADRHNQRAAELQQELDQLRTDMPAVKFADPSKPTWEELHDHLYGAKTVGEAFDRLSGLKELGKTKQLLLKALNQSEFIRSAKLDLSNDLLSYTDANGVEHHDAAGLYDHQNGEHKVTLGATGDVRVLLHEAMHAGTVRLLAEGNTRAAKELNRLYEEFTTTQKAKYQQALEAALKENGALTPAEYAALEKEHLDYGMTNVYEFVAEAFTSRKFQNMLKEITTGQRQKASNSMWGKFVEAVREGLNIPEGARTALDDVLEHGTSLVKKSKDFTSTEIGPTTLPSKSVRPVTLDDTQPPKYLYHGTRSDVTIDTNGNLVLKPSKNYGGKTESVSLTHNQDVAADYAARIKGGGPDGFSFQGAKTIKIHSDAIPESVSRESGEEWAVNTDKPVVIPKGKFEVIEHPLSKSSLTHKDFYNWLKDDHGEIEAEYLLGEGKEGELRKQWLEELAEQGDAEAKQHLDELARLKDVAEKRSAGTYKEPSVEWNKAPLRTPTLASKSVKEMMREEREMLDPRNVKDEEDFYKIATDIFEKSGDKAALDFYDGYKQYKKTWLEPVAETEKFVGTNLRNKLAGERVTSNNKAEILDIAAKDKVNLEELTYKIDRGDKLDGAEKTIAEKFRKFMDDLGKRAMDAGVINGWHEDYVARNVVSEGDAPKGALEEFMRDIFGKGEGGSGGTKTTTKYGEQRRLKTREDLLRHLDGINGWLAENGKDYRFKLKSDNLADIYADYAHSVEKAVENKNLITNLKQVRNAAGESLIRPITKDDPLPHGWEVMDNSELAGYAVHPDLLPALKFVFDAGPGQLMQALGTISQVTKRINVIGSFFHAKSLMEVMSSAQIPIWTPIKEAMVLPLVEKGVKKLTGKDLQLSAISKAVEQYKKGGVGDNVDRWIKEGGLQLDAPEDVSRGMLSSIGKFADSMIGKYGPKTRVLESSLSTVEKYTLGLFDKYTWDYLHTGGKLMVADAYLDKARMQAAEQGKPFDEVAARTEISKFVNDSFGGLNWFDAARSAETELGKRMAMAAYSPAGRRSLQLVLFAPDWTISTLRAFSAALPKSLNPTKLSPVEGIKGMINPTTKADYARLYQFKTAVTYLTLINAINMMISNRPVWENKDPTRIEWPDGTSMQAMKHAMEPVHWIMDPDKTLSNKLGFIPKALIVGIAGTEYASPNAPKLVDRSATNRLATAAQGALPFQVSAAKDAPKGEGAKRALLGTMGFPVYGSTPEQRKLKNAERELQTKELAWKYRDKEIKAGREKMTPEHIKQGNTLAKRRAELNEKLGK